VLFRCDLRGLQIASAERFSAILKSWNLQNLVVSGARPSPKSSHHKSQKESTVAIARLWTMCERRNSIGRARRGLRRTDRCRQSVFGRNRGLQPSTTWKLSGTVLQRSSSGCVHSVSRQRSASWCGCPNVERQCYLCPDGSKPPNPTLVDPVYYGWNCAAFDFVSSYFSEDECEGLVEDIYEFDAPSFCGCPNTSIPDVCDFCPDGQELIKPDLRLGSSEAFTCRELALSTKYIPVLSTCIGVLTSYREKGYMEDCCGVPLWKQNTSPATTVTPFSSRAFITILSLTFLVDFLF
jgi:hypothetical protein